MKTILTEKESQKLIDLGVPGDLATMVHWYLEKDYKGNKIPKKKMSSGYSTKPFTPMVAGLSSFIRKDIFELNNLIDIVPKEIIVEDEKYDFLTKKNSEENNWEVFYGIKTEDGNIKQLEGTSIVKEELIDAIFETIKREIKNQNLKFE